jgi:protein-L-isoaspartate(D-aspartate) O-methyltransferase
MSGTTGAEARIERDVDELVARRHIRTQRVEQAFRRVPRWAGHPATSPAVVAEMLEALELRGGERVLEIGTGTGDNAARLAEITGAPVVTVDRAAGVAKSARASLRHRGEQRVTVVAADGVHGHPAGAPYDRVLVTVGAPGIAEPWMDQLALGGFVVAPVVLLGVHPVLRVERGPPWTAKGRGVCWADVGAGGGALAHQDERVAGPPAPREPSTLGEARSVRRFEPPLDDHQYDGLCAYVTAADRRARYRGSEDLDRALGRCVVRDPGGALAAFHRTGVDVLGGADGAGGADGFAEEMARLTDRWFDDGAPRFTDWTFDLTLEERPAGRFWWPYRHTIGTTGRAGREG